MLPRQFLQPQIGQGSDVPFDLESTFARPRSDFAGDSVHNTAATFPSGGDWVRVIGVDGFSLKSVTGGSVAQGHAWQGQGTLERS